MSDAVHHVKRILKVRRWRRKKKMTTTDVNDNDNKDEENKWNEFV